MTITAHPLDGAVRITSASNHLLTGLGAIGRLIPTAGERVRLSGQTTVAENGIYYAATGAWTRAAAVAGDTLSLLSTGVAAATSWQWEVTSVPSASAIQPGLVLDSRGRPVEVLKVDVVGEYGLTVVGRRIPQAVGGLPPNTQTTIAGVESGTAHVAAVATLPIRTRTGQGATLELVVLNETIYAAALVAAVDEASRVAARETATVAALAALVGVAPSAIGSDLATVVNDLRTNMANHRAVTGANGHVIADVINVSEKYPANSVQYAIDSLNHHYDLYINHAQTGTSGARIHSVDDGKNVPIAAKATDHASATVLAASLRQAYERHRVQVSAPASHGGTGDTANALSTSSLIDNAIVAYLDALVLVGSSVAGEPEGANDLATTFGFRVT